MYTRTLGLDWMMSSVAQGNGGLVAYVSISPQKWEDVCSLCMHVCVYVYTVMCVEGDL